MCIRDRFTCVSLVSTDSGVTGRLSPLPADAVAQRVVDARVDVAGMNRVADAVELSLIHI